MKLDNKLITKPTKDLELSIAKDLNRDKDKQLEQALAKELEKEKDAE